MIIILGSGFGSGSHWTLELAYFLDSYCGWGGGGGVGSLGGGCGVVNETDGDGGGEGDCRGVSFGVGGTTIDFVFSVNGGSAWILKYFNLI